MQICSPSYSAPSLCATNRVTSQRHKRRTGALAPRETDLILKLSPNNEKLQGVTVVRSRKPFFRPAAHVSEAPTTESAPCGDPSGTRSVQTKKIVVLGGSGRVGGSTARSIAALAAEGGLPVELVIAGRDPLRGEQACASLPTANATFVKCDIDKEDEVRRALSGADLVVHTAGPFQRQPRCAVLEAAIATRTAYLDVCDDRSYSQTAKGYHEAARAAGVPAMTTAGIYPGVSNLMAAELVRLNCGEGRRPTSLRYSYYTAGSGGAGPTILATSFLLLGEEALAYKDGKEVGVKPYTSCRHVDFGKGIGVKPVYILSLPEVGSTFSVLGIPSVSARFGTDPVFWNWAMQAMAAFVPQSILQDRSAVQRIVQLSDPLVRQVDKWAGEKVAMRVDLECEDGRKAASIFSHKFLSESVGRCTAAFAVAMLEGSTEAGVWFPEEEGGLGVEAREKLLRRAAVGTTAYTVNSSPWRMDNSPKQLGFGLYLD